MDADGLAFLLLWCVDLLSLFLCHRWLQKVEPDGSQETRSRLRAAVCVLATALALASAWRVNLDMTWPPAVVVWLLSAAVSFGGFNGMFFCAGGDGEHGDLNDCEHGFRTRKTADMSCDLLVVEMAYVTVSVATSAYRSRHDAVALAFLLFCYVDLLSLVLCLKWLEKIEPDGSPEKRSRLRAARCALATALALAFQWRVGLDLPWPAAVVVWSLTVVVSLGGFCAMFVYWGADGEHRNLIPQTDEKALPPV